MDTMAAPTCTTQTMEGPCSPPHLVSLVLQSKKGLQHGEQLCARAHEVARAAAREGIDVVALEAKIRWMGTGVVDQLKIAAGVARSVTEQRARLDEEAKQWDRVRAQHQDALDATLEALGAQRVPPSFHESALAASLFGAPDPPDPDPPDAADARAAWRTLRDFVDERALEDVCESAEEERGALDATLGATAGCATALAALCAHIRAQSDAAAPTPWAAGVRALLVRQERAAAGMAAHLESLAAHYEQLATALREKEAGAPLEDADMQVFVQDTAELPAVVAELEEAVAGIEDVAHEIAQTKAALQASLEAHSRILDSLDSLGERMDGMLKQQSDIELETQATYETLNDYLESLLTLRSTYQAYQMSYNALVLEMERRRRYRDRMEAEVQVLQDRLDRLRDDEIRAREAFHAAHAASIPDDLCLAISNLPQTFAIWSPAPGSDQEGGVAGEVLPEIDDDLLLEARERVDAAPAPSRDVQDALVMPVRPSPRREDSL